ncbi:MAG: hypothetical protein P8184_13250 [Calditrichia bacterium]
MAALQLFEECIRVLSSKINEFCFPSNHSCILKIAAGEYHRNKINLFTRRDSKVKSKQKEYAAFQRGFAFGVLPGMRRLQMRGCC